MTDLTINPSNFFRAFSQVALAAPKAAMGVPAELSNVHAVAEGETLHLIASDRYRIHYAHSTLMDPVAEPVRFSMPQTTAADLKALGWGRKTGAPALGTLTVGDGSVEVSAAGGDSRRYALDYSEFTLDRQLFPLLTQFLQMAGNTEHDTVTINPAFQDDVARAARLIDRKTNITCQRAEKGTRSAMVYRLTSGSYVNAEDNGFRAVVIAIRQPGDTPEGTLAHADVLSGIETAQEGLHQAIMTAHADERATAVAAMKNW